MALSTAKFVQGRLNQARFPLIKAVDASKLAKFNKDMPMQLLRKFSDAE